MPFAALRWVAVALGCGMVSAGVAFLLVAGRVAGMVEVRKVVEIIGEPRIKTYNVGHDLGRDVLVGVAFADTGEDVDCVTVAREDSVQVRLRSDPASRKLRVVLVG